MKNMMVSVIVPVYNVEAYLKKCIDSILRQRYQNYEIILVDDGSTDNSGAICDRYAARYECVIALHKENGGLSEARNHALPHIKGQYVTFVDSDDYIEDDYISNMVNVLDEETDMVIAPYIVESAEGKIIKDESRHLQKKPEKMSAEQALKELCYERKIHTSACAKLVSKELVENFPFPAGKKFEDLFTIYKMIGSSGVISLIPVPSYHYVQRNGSIRNSAWDPYMFDIMEASDSLLSYINNKYPGVRPAAVHRLFFSANELYAKAASNKDYLQIIYPFQERLRSYWPTIQKDPEIRLAQKIKYGIMTFSPSLYRNIRRITGV